MIASTVLHACLLLLSSSMFPVVLSQQATVELLADISPGDFSSYAEHYTVLNDKLFFEADSDGWVLEATGEDGDSTLTKLPNPTFYLSPSYFYLWNDIVYVFSYPGLFEYIPTDNGGILEEVYANFNIYSGHPSPVEFGDKLYFVASDFELGSEIWYTDGTFDGTARLYDFTPGSSGSYPSTILASSEKLFIQLNTDIWVSDGTSEGTVKFNAPLVDGLGSITMYENMVVYEDRLYFRGSSDAYGSELWSTDGTIEGTQLVADLSEGSLSSYPTDFGIINNKLIFFADDDLFETKLWVIDDTSSGPRAIWTASSFFYISSEYTEFGGKLIFTEEDDTSSKIFTTDGTEEGSGLLADILPWTNPRGFTVLEDHMYFLADLGDTTGLWVSDGTTEGTKEVPSTWIDSVPSFGSINPNYREPHMTAFNSQLYFTASNPTTGDEPWKVTFIEGDPIVSEPEPEENNGVSVELVLDINPGAGDSDARAYAVIGETLYFAADNENFEGDVYVVTASEPRASLLELSSSYFFEPYVFYEFDGMTLVFASAGIYITDGTEAGSEPLSTEIKGTYSTEVLEYKGNLYFTGYDSSWSSGIFYTDGTAEGTKVMIKDIESPREMTATDDVIFFQSWDSNSSSTILWTSDGTMEGTSEFDLANGTLQLYDGSFLAAPAPLNAFCFRVNDSFVGEELACSDGTYDGTYLVVDAEEGQRGSYPDHFGLLKDPTVIVWFAQFTVGSSSFPSEYMLGYNSTNIFLVWIPPSFFSGPEEYIEFQGTLIFREASWWSDVSEVYVTDGTFEGTGIMFDISPWTNPRHFVVMDDMLYFLADFVDTTSLWMSDGTQAGTIEVTTKWPNDVVAWSTVEENYFSPDSTMVGFNGDLYFTASNGTTGREPWRVVLSDMMDGTMNPSSMDSETMDPSVDGSNTMDPTVDGSNTMDPDIFKQHGETMDPSDSLDPSDTLGPSETLDPSDSVPPSSEDSASFDPSETLAPSEVSSSSTT